MLWLPEEVDEERAKDWSKERLKVEKEEAEISDRKKFMYGACAGWSFIVIGWFIGLFIVSIPLGIYILIYWKKKRDQYKTLQRLWKKRLIAREIEMGLQKS